MEVNYITIKLTAYPHPSTSSGRAEKLVALLTDYTVDLYN